MQAHEYPALVLNADYRPLSMMPLETWNWQDAIRATTGERAVVIDTYERYVSSPSTRLRLPSVIALKEYQTTKRPAAFTRMNVLVRDAGRCAYCGVRLNMRTLTFDHVVPQSKGGRTTWRNVVSSCDRDNAIKGGKWLKDSGLSLAREPIAPTHEDLNRLAAEHFVPRMRGLHATWLAWLPTAIEASRASDEHQAPSVDGAFPAGMTAADYWGITLDEA